MQKNKINKTNNNIFTINTLKINYTKKRILRKLIIIFLILILVIILKVQAAQASRGALFAAVSTQCYFGSYPARFKVSLGPCLAVPKPKCHLTLGLQSRGSRPSSTWRLGCPPSGGNSSATCLNVVFFIVIAVFKNLLMMIIILILL